MWGTAQLIEINNAGDAVSPKVAMDADGNAIAVWQQSDGTRNNIWANLFTPAGEWGSPQLLETDNAGHAYDPQVAMNANGSAVAVWRQSDGTHDNIWEAHYNPANAWGTAQLIEIVNDGDAAGPQVAIDSSGNSSAVWQQSDSARNNIWANRAE